MTIQTNSALGANGGAAARRHSIDAWPVPTRRGFLGAGLAALAVPAQVSTAGPPPTAPDAERVKALLAAQDPITWLFTGDSIAMGAFHTFGWRSYCEHFGERIRFELLRRRDVVINTGISGDTTTDLLRDLDHRVLRFRPQVVSIMLGMNDCVAGVGGREECTSRYDEILRRVRADTKAALIVHTYNPITPSALENRDIPAYMDIIRTAAKKHQAILVDHDKVWRDRKSPLNYLLNDGALHPNQFGHILMAHATCQALGVHDSTSPLGRLFVP